MSRFDVPLIDADYAKRFMSMYPFVASMTSRKRSQGPFGYDYSVTILSRTELFTRWFTYDELGNLRYMRNTFDEIERTGLSSRWLTSTDKRSADVCGCSFTRLQVGLDNVQPFKGTGGVRRDVFHPHGHWMLEVFQKWGDVELIGKRANVVTSPNTFMFQTITTHAMRMHTWMKYPSLDKYNTRATQEPKRWSRIPSEECGQVFTRAEVFAFFGEEDPHAASFEKLVTAANQRTERIAQGYERDTKPGAATYETPEALVAKVGELLGSCVDCGCSFGTNSKFGTGADARCGDCQVKKAGDFAWDDCKVGPVVDLARLPKKLRDARFDARPGIDDEGLGFYSPTWED